MSERWAMSRMRVSGTEAVNSSVKDGSQGISRRTASVWRIQGTFSGHSGNIQGIKEHSGEHSAALRP
jgi:hypothetical protein